MKNIAVYAPLLGLRQKTKYPYCMLSLSLAVMLFILEDMIKGEKNSTYETIAYFLQELVTKNYQEPLSYEEALELTHYLVRENLLNEGKPHSLEYQNMEEGKETIERFHLLELDSYDVKSKIVYLKLSSDGLEMLFKTKEIYRELQVTIAQLYLRQQIQKGVFQGALRTVEELALAVRNEKERLRQLEERIIRDVLQVAREKELEKQFQRIDDQLQREQEVFQELAGLIESTMARYYEHAITPKEEQAIHTITRVRRRLFDVIYEHEALFREKLRIHHVMIRAVESRILTSFTTKVNFETEFLRPVTQKDMELTILKQIVDPILPIFLPKHFHPGRIFQGQKLKGEEEDVSEEVLWAEEEERIRQEEEKEEEQEREKIRFLKSYFHCILPPLLTKHSYRLSTLLEQMKKEEPEFFFLITERMDFYSFLIQLHQLGEIPLERSEEFASFIDTLPRVLLDYIDRHPEIEELKSFSVRATEEILRLPSGFVMSDFLICKEEETHAVE